MSRFTATHFSYTNFDEVLVTHSHYLLLFYFVFGTIAWAGIGSIFVEPSCFLFGTLLATEDPVKVVFVCFCTVTTVPCRGDTLD